MSCTLDKQLIEETIAFHGHNCPGLTIGLRASELAREKLGLHKAENPLCVAETDMCGVDAIQFLTGCSYGKGNLIHKDFGKSAFTFFNRDTQKGFRAIFLNPPIAQSDDRQARIQEILEADLEDLFEVQPIDKPPVKGARILKSIKCDACNENTMESRIRLFDGKQLCIPCFEKVEQKQ